MCHLQHKLIGFYNRAEKCLQRGTDWGFKENSLRFAFKGLNLLAESLGLEGTAYVFIPLRKKLRPSKTTKLFPNASGETCCDRISFFPRYPMFSGYTVSGLPVQGVNPTVVSHSLQGPSTQPLYLHSRNITVTKFSAGRTTTTLKLYYWCKSSSPPPPRGPGPPHSRGF